MERRTVPMVGQRAQPAPVIDIGELDDVGGEVARAIQRGFLAVGGRQRPHGRLPDLRLEGNLHTASLEPPAQLLQAAPGLDPYHLASLAIVFEPHHLIELARAHQRPTVVDDRRGHRVQRADGMDR